MKAREIGMIEWLRQGSMELLSEWILKADHTHVF